MTTSMTVPGSVEALEVLALIPVSREHQEGYDRDRFDYPDDRDGDGCDTRAEVLIQESTTRPQIDPVGCTVDAGDCPTTTAPGPTRPRCRSTTSSPSKTPTTPAPGHGARAASTDSATTCATTPEAHPSPHVNR
jgi:hypothetical protein